MELLQVERSATSRMDSAPFPVFNQVHSPAVFLCFPFWRQRTVTTSSNRSLSKLQPVHPQHGHG